MIRKIRGDKRFLGQITEEQLSSWSSYPFMANKYKLVCTWLAVTAWQLLLSAYCQELRKLLPGDVMMAPALLGSKQGQIHGALGDQRILAMRGK